MYVSEQNGDVIKFTQIYTWRTDNGGARSDCKTQPDKCDDSFEAYNPLNFDFFYEGKFVQWFTHEVIKGKRRKIRHSKYVEWPNYRFKKQRFSHEAWLHIARILQVLHKEIDLETNVPEIFLRYKWLSNILSQIERRKVKVSRLRNSPTWQHVVVHEKSNQDTVDEPDPLSAPWGATAYPYKEYARSDAYLYSTQLPPGHVIKAGDTQFRPKNDEFRDGIAEFTEYVGSTKALQSMTLWLWPDVADYSDTDRAQPVVDLAEALADGSLIGEPPSMNQFQQSLNGVDRLSKSLDLAALISSAFLWKALVIEPVWSSMVASAASVVSNDILLDSLEAKAKSGLWFQGKSRPYTKDDRHFLFYRGATFNRVTNAMWTTPIEDTLTYDVAAYGQMRFQIDYDIITYAQHSSGMRLSLFFNRLSTDLGKVAYNVIPLSFVFDWFSSRVSGNMNLQDKVQVPLKDWVVTSSYKLETDIEREGQFTAHGEYWLLYKWIGGINYRYGNIGWRPPDYDLNLTYPFNAVLDRDYRAYTTMFRKEKYTKYMRWISYRPKPVDPSEFDMPYRPTLNEDPLNNGKEMTLGALIIALSWQ